MFDGSYFFFLYVTFSLKSAKRTSQCERASVFIKFQLSCVWLFLFSHSRCQSRKTQFLYLITIIAVNLNASHFFFFFFVSFINFCIFNARNFRWFLHIWFLFIYNGKEKIRRKASGKTETLEKYGPFFSDI